MVVKEQDLAFVRCPSCNSLIPSTAKRCRMCGYVLSENEASRSGTETLKPRSRVKQRTVSLSPEKVSELKKGLGGSDESPTPADKSELIANTLMESVEDKVVGISGTEETARQPLAAAMEEFVVEKKSQHLMPDASRGREVDRRGRSEGGDLWSSIRNDQDIAQDTTKEPHIVSEDEPEPVDTADEVSAPIMSAGEEDTNRFNNVAERDASMSREIESQVDNARGPLSTLVGEGAQVSKDAGTLVGWLVNFEDDPRGRSMEVRSGKFMISNQRLRDSDIRLAHKSVSTPHCLLVAAPGSGLIVLDLMSECGTFVKRTTETNFKRYHEAVTLASGDVLRLGDYALTVVLLP